MEIFVIIGMVFLLIGIVLFYRSKISKVKGEIISEFDSQRNQETTQSVKKIENLETRIEFLTDTKRLLELQLEEMTLKSKQDNKKSLALGANIIKGELVQILASFCLLAEYDNIALVSSVSQHASFDLIGVKQDSIDFIEVKAGTAPLSHNESKIQRLIESHKVRYRIIEGRLPQLDLKVREPNKTI